MSCTGYNTDCGAQHVLPTQNLASWAYQRVCDYLWDYQEPYPKTQDLISSYL